MPRRADQALAGAAAGIVLLFVTWFFAFHVGFAKSIDQSIFSGFNDVGQHPHVGRLASFIAQLCNPNPYLYLAAVPVLIALVRRRGWVAVAICAILLGANVTTHLLKPLLAAPRADGLLGGYNPVGAASWPSGHATAAMSLALCLVLAVPGRVRPWAAALGAGFAVAVSFSFLSLGWHYPSDVLGGFLVAGVWTLLALAALLRIAPREEVEPSPGADVSLRRAITAPAVMLIGALGLALAAAVLRPHQVVDLRRRAPRVRDRRRGDRRAGPDSGQRPDLRAAPLTPARRRLHSARRLVRVRRRGSGPAPTAAPRRRWLRG